MSLIADIEDAFIARIQSAVLGYTLGTVASYGGELSGDANQMAMLIRSFPAVWVVFHGEDKPKPLGTSKTKWIADAAFSLLVATHSVRGERFTRHGAPGTGEVGAYQILADLRTLFLNQDLGMAIDRLKPGATKSLFNARLNSQQVAVFAQEWHTRYVMSEPVAPAPDLTAVDLQYFLNAADAQAEASDLVTLPPK